jgi:hypothetical protein
MSEENTNDIIPAVLEEGEAVIPAEKVEEFQTLAEEVLEASEEVVEESAALEEPVAEEVVAETKVEQVAAELDLEPKISVVEEVEDKNVISSASQKKAKPSDLAAGLTGVAGGVIGTGTVKRKPAVKQPKKDADDKVALNSTRNVSWVGVGKVLKGINIVTKDQAEKWLTRDHITVVKPEDVAREFGR